MQKQHLKRATAANPLPNGPSHAMRRVVTEAYMRFEAPSATTEDIRRRAYQRWEDAGKPSGDGLRFWLEAERELTQPK